MQLLEKRYRDIFDIRITNLEAVSNRESDPRGKLERQEKEKKEKICTDMFRFAKTLHSTLLLSRRTDCLGKRDKQQSRDWPAY